MAEQQAAVVDLPDEYTEEWAAQFDLKAYKAAASVTAAVLFDASRELSKKKQPLLKRLLSDTALMIDTVDLASLGAFEAIKERGEDEDRIIARITNGEAGYYGARTDASEAALIAEIVYERERLDRLWEKIEEVDRVAKRPATGEANDLVAAWKDATLQLHHSVFRAIVEGKVDAGGAIRALKGQKAIDLNHTEYPWLIPSPGGAAGDDLVRSVLAGISEDIKARAANLPDDSEWSTPLAHLADRLGQGAARAEGVA